MAEKTKSKASLPQIYGFMAEFESADDVVKAAKEAYQQGYRKLDAYTPFPVDGLSEAIGFHKDRVALITFLGGVLGAILGYGLQYYTSAVDYPINVGGRPYNSWPAFMPITFELMVLCAALSAVVGMFILNGFPRPYHPVFNSPHFQLATKDRFFLAIELEDPKFDPKKTREFLESLKPVRVEEVEP